MKRTVAAVAALLVPPAAASAPAHVGPIGGLPSLPILCSLASAICGPFGCKVPIIIDCPPRQ